MYRRVLELANKKCFQSHDFDANALARGSNVTEQQSRGQFITSDDVPDYLLALDSANRMLLDLEGFKRARLLSSWWNLNESKGPLRWTIRGIRFWSVSGSTGIGNMEKNQLEEVLMSRFVQERVTRDLLEVRHISHKEIDVSMHVFAGTFFVGHNLRTARPVVIIACDSPFTRQRALNVAKGLLPKDSHFLVAAASPLAFGSREYWKGVVKINLQRCRKVCN